MNVLLYFFAYSFLGWVCECIYCSIPAKKFINRGFLAGPYCPIYGFGALAVIHILTPFGGNVLLMFIMGILVTSALEYVTSWGMEVLFHTKWWDYSTYPFNIHGRVCLKNSLMFGCMVLVVYYLVHPLILDSIAVLPTPVQMVLSILFVLGFGYDVFTTAHALLRKNVDFAAVEDSIRELREDFKQAQIFPLSESLSDTIAKVLDSTNADEVLLSHIDKLHQRIQHIHEKSKRTHERLSKAFPNRKEALTRINAEHVFRIINEHRRGHTS